MLHKQKHLLLHTPKTNRNSGRDTGGDSSDFIFCLYSTKTGLKRSFIQSGPNNLSIQLMLNLVIHLTSYNFAPESIDQLLIKLNIVSLIFSGCSIVDECPALGI